MGFIGGSMIQRCSVLKNGRRVGARAEAMPLSTVQLNQIASELAVGERADKSCRGNPDTTRRV
jgi:hypothetical protein